MFRPVGDPTQALLTHARRTLDPVERFSEIIFGLIMVLTFTGSLSVATSGRQEVREMLIGALGCNLAWGIVDGVLYVITGLVERARLAALLGVLQGAGGEATARELIRTALPEGVALVTDDADIERMRTRARRLATPLKARLRGEDLRGAFGVFLLVFLATFPVVVPFILVSDAARALRLSDGVAIVMLFISGSSLGRATGIRPVTLGGAMVVLGMVLVGITIALGG